MKKKRRPIALIDAAESISNAIVTELPALPGCDHFILDISRLLFLSGSEDIVYFDFPSPFVTADVAWNAARDTIRSYGKLGRIKIIALPNLPESLHQKAKDALDDTILLDSESIGLRIRSKTFITFMRDLLTEHFDVSRLMPYQYQGAVTGNRFFGREDQLRAILNHPEKSYVVSGNRMSGKTSLLLEAKRRLEENAARSSRPNTVYIDCKTYDSSAGFLKAILVELGERTSLSSAERWMSPHKLPDFTKYLRDFVRSRPDKRLYLFLDEYDQVLKIERLETFKITWSFRSLFQTNSKQLGVIQFVVAGSKALASESENTKADLYNFVTPDGAGLANFNLGIVKKVLSRPMEDLGFEVEDLHEIGVLMLQETAGRPSSVQYLCYKIAEAVVARGERRVHRDILQEIVNAPEYLQFYEASVHENTDALEGFILCTYAQEGAPPRFAQEDLQKCCEEHSVHVEEKRLFGGLQDLETSGFIVPDKQSFGHSRYELAVPIIRRIFRHRSPVSYVKSMIREGSAIPFTEVQR